MLGYSEGAQGIIQITGTNQKESQESCKTNECAPIESTGKTRKVKVEERKKEREKEKERE